MKVGIIILDRKLGVFEKHLRDAGYSFKRSKGPT